MRLGGRRVQRTAESARETYERARCLHTRDASTREAHLRHLGHAAVMLGLRTGDRETRRGGELTKPLPSFSLRKSTMRSVMGSTVEGEQMRPVMT